MPFLRCRGCCDNRTIRNRTCLRLSSTLSWNRGHRGLAWRQRLNEQPSAFPGNCRSHSFSSCAAIRPIYGSVACAGDRRWIYRDSRSGMRIWKHHGARFVDIGSGVGVSLACNAGWRCHRSSDNEFIEVHLWPILHIRGACHSIIDAADKWARQLARR